MEPLRQGGDGRQREIPACAGMTFGCNQGEPSPTLKGVFYIETRRICPRMGLFNAQKRFIMEQFGLFSHLARVLLINGRKKTARSGFKNLKIGDSK